MLTFEEFEKLPEDATIYVADVGIHTFKKFELRVRDFSAITCYNKTASNQKLYKEHLLIPWRICFLTQKEAQAYREAGQAFIKGGEVTITKGATTPQRSMCGVPYAPPRTMHLPKEICKKIISGNMTKLIENFPRLPLDYALVVEGEDKSFATIQVFSSERFDLPDRVADFKTLLEAVWDSRGEITLSDGDDLAFCRSCGFSSIEDFVTHYDKASTCSYYIHTIYPLIVDANKFKL